MKKVIKCEKMILSLLESRTDAGIRLGALLWWKEHPNIKTTEIVRIHKNAVERWTMDWLGDIRYKRWVGFEWESYYYYSRMMNEVLEYDLNVP